LFIVNAEQKKVLLTKTPAEKLAIAEQLYQTARAVKAASLRAFHPDWTEERIAREVRDIFLAAHT
jgi:hypothetical protein